MLHLNFFVGTFIFYGNVRGDFLWEPLYLLETFLWEPLFLLGPFFAGPLYLYEPFLQTFFLWGLFMGTLDFLSEAASAEQIEQMGKLAWAWEREPPLLFEMKSRKYDWFSPCCNCQQSTFFVETSNKEKRQPPICIFCILYVTTTIWEDN